MKVRIVEKKEDVKEMTIDELAKYNFVGVKHDGIKYFLSHSRSCSTYTFVGANTTLWVVENKRSAVLAINGCCVRGEFHVFDTATGDEGLYAWMAEE